MINDPDGIHVVVTGERWYKFASTYKHQGDEFSFSFFARSSEEATQVLRAIRTTAVNWHQISAEVSAATPMAGAWVRFLCWWRNIFRR